MKAVFSKISILLALLGLLSSCSTTAPTATDPDDQFEKINRDAYRFNDKLDQAIVKPVAQGYTAVTPYPVRQGIANFFDNLFLPSTIFYDAIQGNGTWFMSDSWRFVINSTVGIAGLFDVAKHMDLPEHDNDFELTLNHWGIYTSYLVVPFWGPRTVGNMAGIGIDSYAGITDMVVPWNYMIEVMALYGLNTRANLLSLEQSASGMMLDPYIFMRNAYYQNLAYERQINDAGPPSLQAKTADDDDEWVQ